VQFDRNCAVCHGTSGRGGRGELAHGIVGAYGLSSEPANLVAPKPGTGVPAPPAPAQPDGQLFDTITNGRGSMPGYGHQIRDVLDRWAVVAYLRSLQFAYEPPAGSK
jgi:mono/diheme cytochrome c family protein